MLLRELPAGLTVLFYRKISESQEEQFKFIHIEEEIVVVQTPWGRKHFVLLVLNGQQTQAQLNWRSQKVSSAEMYTA